MVIVSFPIVLDGTIFRGKLRLVVALSPSGLILFDKGLRINVTSRQN